MAWVRPKPERRNVIARELILNRLRQEYRDLPALRLTGAQVRRLLGLRADICQRVLHSLVDEGTLCPDATGRYTLCDRPQLRGWIGHRPVPSGAGSSVRPRKIPQRPGRETA